MKKQFLIIFLCIGSLFCVAQETTVKYYFPVNIKCTGYERPYLFHIYDWHLEEPNDDNPNLFLSWAVYEYDRIPLKAIIKDDDSITITSSRFTEDGDYKGSGIITKDYVSIDYTISWENSEYVETCHLESVPYFCPTFSFCSGNLLWTYITKNKNNQIVGTSQYRYKTFYDLSHIEMPVTFVTYEQNQRRYLLLEASYDNGKTWEDVTYMRAESNKVYTLNIETKKETLLYDFNLKPNDTFNNQVLRSVDTVDVGIYKKEKYEFSNDIWIKDIGSINRPCFDTKTIPSDYIQDLLCVQFNPEVYSYSMSSNFRYLWKNSNYETCYCEQTAIEPIEFQQITISPNPVKDVLNLTLPTANNEIKIFDLQGKLLLQQNVGETATIHVSMLQTGTYVLIINNSESLTFVKQ